MAARLRAPGLTPRGRVHAARRAVRRPRWSRSSASPTASRTRSTAPTAGTRAFQNAVLTVVADRRAAVLPRRPRRLRLLVLLGGGQADAARGPLLARRPLVEGLLPRQHRPQGDRHPVRRHLVLLHAGRRPAGDAGARRAGGAGLAVRRRQRLQRALQRPRVADDLPVHHPGLRGAGELRPAADDRRAGHGVPAPERAVVLDAAAGRR